MGMRKFGTGKVIDTDESGTDSGLLKQSSREWAEQDQQALDQENQEADQFDLGSQE